MSNPLPTSRRSVPSNAYSRLAYLGACALFGCGGPTSSSASHATTGAESAPRQAPIEIEAPPCRQVLSGSDATFMLGVAADDATIDNAMIQEIVAVVIGVDVEGSMSGDRAVLRSPVRGYFEGTLEERCDEPPTTSLATMRVTPAPLTLPRGAEAVSAVTVDVDEDGSPDRVRVYVTEDEQYALIGVTLSWYRAETSFRMSLEDGLVSGCFGVVDRTPAYFQSLVRGSEAGVRVHTLEENGTWTPQSGLLGRPIAGTRADEPTLLSPPASPALWQGDVTSWIEALPRRCPMNGRAIDVPRDGHYPIEDEPDLDELALLRVGGLSRSYDALPEGPGPIVEVRTASNP